MQQFISGSSNGLQEHMGHRAVEGDYHYSTVRTKLTNFTQLGEDEGLVRDYGGRIEHM